MGPSCGRIPARREHPKKSGGQVEQALGRSRGGFSTKIHTKVDGLGNPLQFILTGGERHESTQGEALLSKQVGDYVLGDRAFDDDDFIAFIIRQGATPVIPPRKNRKEPREYDTWRYRERALIECFFSKRSEEHTSELQSPKDLVCRL